MRQFFPPPQPMTVGDLVALTGATASSNAVLDHAVRGIAALDQAGPFDLVFADNPKYGAALKASEGGVCLVTPQLAELAPAGAVVLTSAKPFRDFVVAARALFPDSLQPHSVFGSVGVAETADVHATAELEDGVIVDPGAVIGPGAGIGSGTVIAANAVIGPGVQIGRSCSIGSGCSLSHTLIGDSVTLHPGCRIGQDGFRYHFAGGQHVKVPQLGRVIIQDRVEIGANTTIDRGGMGDTVIGEGTKIDNLVQIGHNCQIGRHCIIVAACGLAGSVTLQDYVVLGGQVGIADHVTIGEGAMLAAQSGVMSDIPAGEAWMGAPAMPRRDFLRMVAAQRKKR